MKIPTRTRRVQDQGTSAGQASAKAPLVGLSNIGKNLERLGKIQQQASKEAEALRERAERTEEEKAVRKLRNEADRLFTDKDIGFTNKRGRNTLDDYKTYKEDFNKFSETLVGEAGTDSLKRRLSERFTDLRAGFTRKLDGHTAKEMDAYEVQEHEANIDALSRSAVLNYKEAGPRGSKVRESIEEKNRLIDQFGADRGLPSSVIKEQKLNTTSSLHEKVIKQAINNDEDRLAKAYLSQAKKKKELTEDSVIRLEKLVNGANTRGESQRVTDRIIQSTPKLSDALTQARAIEDPEVRDETVRRVKNRFAEKKLLDDIQTQELGEQTYQVLEQFGNIDKLPEDLQQSLRPAQAKAVKQYSRLMSKGVKPTTDPVVFNDLMLLASSPETKDKFMRTDLTTKIHKLSPGDFKSLLGMQKAIKKGSSEYDEQFGSFISNTQVMNNTLTEIGIKDKAKQAKFKSEVQAQALQWQRVNQKKKIPNDVLKEISDRLAMEVVVDKGFFNDTERRAFEVSPTESVEEIDFEQIPENDRKELRNYFTKKNIEFNEEQAAELYLNFLRNN